MPVPRYESCGNPACPYCNGLAIDDPRPGPDDSRRRAFFRVAGIVLLSLVALTLVAMAFAVTTSAHGQTLPTTAPTSRPAVTWPKGIVSAWYYPPIENLAQVKARGCNAVVGPELGNPARVTARQWCDEAARLGLGVIGDAKLLQAGYVPPNLIGWIVRDEPTSANHNYPPEAIAAEAAAFRAVRPDLPAFCTHAGDKLTSAGAKDDAMYERYVAAVDASLEDWYPINREFGRYWGPTQKPPLKVRALNYLKARGAKVVGSVVETGWQKLNKGDPKGRAPTPDEYEQQVNESLAAGARFIVHFSTAEAGYPWPLAYDPTPADVVARITSVNARLNPPPSPPPDPVALLKSDLATAQGQIVELKAAVATQVAAQAATDATLDRLRQALATTRPATTQPNP